MRGPVEILVLSHLVPWPTTSGVLLRSYNLLREVARRHRVYLYAFNQDVLLSPDQVADSVRHLSEICQEVKVFPLPGGGTRFHLAAQLARNLFSPLPYEVPRFYSPALEQAVIDLLGRRPIRLLQFETIAMFQYRELAQDLPAILVHQNVESDLLHRRARLDRNPFACLVAAGEARKLARYEETVCPQADVNVTVSEEDRAAFRKRIPEARFEVVVNGVDVDTFHPGADPAGRGAELVFVGGMSWYPNRDAMRWFLAKVWPRIRKQLPEARLTVVGSHPSPEVRRAEARGHGVRATGLVDDIRPIVQEAALVVCPLRIGGGTRLKILDAWAMGKAIVSTSLGCEGLESQSGREIEIADQPEDLAARVVELLGDRERRLRLGKAGRARAEAEFAWPKVGAGMVGLIEELASQAEVMEGGGGSEMELEREPAGQRATRRFRSSAGVRANG
jgi:sugar transferase (PEP-CTERM/EpsH1 system associated)